MPAGNQPPPLGGVAVEETAPERPSQAETHGSVEPPPRASGAGLVPAAAIAGHVVVLWWGPSSATLLRPWLPLPLEALLVWLPWVSTCIWAANRATGAHRGQRLGDGLIAGTALACAGHYVLNFRVPAGQEGWSTGRMLSELAAFFSTTSGGIPWRAGAYALGWAATAAVLARILGDVASQSGAGPRTGSLGRAVALVIFLIGSSALLRYATGSPWPLLGSS